MMMMMMMIIATTIIMKKWTPKGVGVNGRKSADRTKHENYVIFFAFLAIVFGKLEVWKVKKWNIFLEYINATV